VLFIKGISLTTAGNSSLFLATVPVWTAVFSVVMRKDRLNKAAWIGIVLAFIGVAIVTIGSGQKFSLSGSKTIGNLIMLLAASCWAGYTILSRDLLQRYSPLRLTALAMITGAVGLWIFAIPEVIKQSWADVSPKVWGAVAFSGIMALVVGYIIWAEGVKKIGPARTAIFSNVTPIVAFVVAFLMLGESITWLQGLGGMTILYGVSLTIRN
jgi:drug/metabolite transporter (DMT)-like permease